MSAAEEARRFAALADIARVAPTPKPPAPVQEADEDPETFFARVAALRLLAEPCDG